MFRLAQSKCLQSLAQSLMVITKPLSASLWRTGRRSSTDVAKTRFTMIDDDSLRLFDEIRVDHVPEFSRELGLHFGGDLLVGYPASYLRYMIKLVPDPNHLGVRTGALGAVLVSCISVELGKSAKTKLVECILQGADILTRHFEGGSAVPHL
jgi:hypothetical protein